MAWPAFVKTVFVASVIILSHNPNPDPSPSDTVPKRLTIQSLRTNCLSCTYKRAADTSSRLSNTDLLLAVTAVLLSVPPSGLLTSTLVGFFVLRAL